MRVEGKRSREPAHDGPPGEPSRAPQRSPAPWRAWMDRDGVSSILSLLVATGVFTVAFIGIIDTAARTETGGNKGEETHHEAMADAMAELMLARGLKWYDGNEATMCVDGQENPAALNADAVGATAGGGRFGLGAERCDDTGLSGSSNVLSFQKIANLYEALRTATDNDRVDYAEARRSLSLDSGAFNFHVRSWPILNDLDAILRGGAADQFLKVAYIGDYEEVQNGAPVNKVVDSSAGVTDDGDYVTVWVDVHNNGTSSTIFEVQFSLRLSQATVYFTGHTPLLAPDASFMVTKRLWKSSDWQWPNEGSQPGSIRLCTVLLNAAGTVGNGAPGSTLKLYGTDDAGGYTSVSAFSPMDFQTPTTLNADLMGNDAISDANCVTRSNLPLGGYFYGQATVAGSGWTEPKYNDENPNAVFTLADFYPYSEELFTPSPSDDNGRNTNSDGHLILTNQRPSRTIVLLAQDTGEGSYTGPASPAIAFPKEVQFTISDVADAVGKGHIDFTPITMTAASERNLLFANSDKLFFDGTGANSVSAKVNFATYEGDGTQEKFADWTMRLYDPSDVQTGGDRPLPNAKTGSETFSITTKGAYDARIDDDALTTLWNTDVVNVETAPIDAFTPGATPGSYAPQSSTLTEVAFLDLLYEKFGPNVHSATYDAPGLAYAAGGDVYPDIKEVMNTDFAPLLLDDMGTPSTSDDVGSLETYNLLVAGSNVAHQTMTSDAIKGAIEKWVQAGGTLIVFGSTSQGVQWLQPLFHSSITSANGGLYTPDEDHPILTTPNDLEYAPYKRVSTWTYSSDADEKFTHVVKEGPTDADPDLLAVGHSGSFGLGRIILTGYQPFDLTTDQGGDCTLPLEEGRRCEAVMLMQNLLSQGYRELYIDYGPRPPTNAVTSIASRIATVWHPDLDQEIEIHLKVWVFVGSA